MQSKGKVLIIGNPDVELIVERSGIPARGGYRVYWFIWNKPKTEKIKQATWLSGIIVPPNLPRGGRPVTALTLYWTFLRLQPCIVHVHYAQMHALQSRWVGRLHPLIVSVMGGDIMPDQGFRGEFVEPTMYLLNQADIITTKSAFMDQRLDQLGDFRPRIRRVTWGMLVEEFKPGLDASDLRQKWNLSEDDVVLFCVRACEPLMNKIMVAQAFAHCLFRTTKPVKLLISEYHTLPEYSQQLRQTVKEAGIEEHVRFIGSVPLSDMPIYYNLADAVISVPFSDGMPQTLYQAMSCGTYAIIGDIPQTREILDLGCELAVVPVNNLNALAMAMTTVVESTQEVRQAGLRNRARILPLANKSDQDRVIVAIYDELLAKTFSRKLDV